MDEFMLHPRTFVIGDIHGRATALNQVLHKARFRMDTDRLITMGDICDGGRHTKQCFDILLKVKNRIDVLGNHDLWFLGWILGSAELPIWVHQGGYNTLYSYNWDRKNVPMSHYKLLMNARPYVIDDKNRIYVHGGFNPKVPIEKQKIEFLIWDRTLIQYAKTHKVPGYTHAFVGHTTTQLIRKGWVTPLTFNNLTMTDCGGGWNGHLALINVDNLQDFYLSDVQKPQEEPDDPDYPDTEEWAW